jgi:hypothetical protein
MTEENHIENNISESENNRLEVNQRFFSETGLESNTNNTLKKDSTDSIGVENQNELINHSIDNKKSEDNSLKNDIHNESKNESLSTTSIIAINKNTVYKIKKLCTIKTRRIYNIVVLIFGILLILISIYDLLNFKKEKNKTILLKKWYIFIFEILSGIMRIGFFFLNIFVIKEKKTKNPIILLLNIILIVLFLLIIIIFSIGRAKITERVINLDYCLFLFLSSLASILNIKAEVKKKKNEMQNIEEIINFTEINQHGHEKKFEKKFLNPNSEKGTESDKDHNISYENEKIK